jgi:hypothetical protein
MGKLTPILKERLERKGIDPGMIPAFIRNLSYAISLNPHQNLMQLNHRLHDLGWGNFDLDSHTLQLAIACIETETTGFVDDQSSWHADSFEAIQSRLQI